MSIRRIYTHSLLRDNLNGHDHSGGRNMDAKDHDDEISDRNVEQGIRKLN